MRYRIHEHFCVGGSDEPFEIDASEMPAYLLTIEVDETLEEILSGEKMKDGNYQINRTREGCLPSDVCIEPLS